MKAELDLKDEIKNSEVGLTFKISKLKTDLKADIALTGTTPWRQQRLLAVDFVGVAIDAAFGEAYMRVLLSGTLLAR